MAIGFKRLPGTSRRYQNVSNPNYPPGFELSYRQYDKLVEFAGEKQRVGSVNDIPTLSRQIERASLSLLDSTRADLKDLQKRLNRILKTSKGQKTFNTTLDAFVQVKRDAGIKITKREAARSAEFKSTLSDVKATFKNDGKSAAQQKANQTRRDLALIGLGGYDAFQNLYAARYGGTGHRFTKAAPSKTPRSRNKG